MKSDNRKYRIQKAPEKRKGFSYSLKIIAILAVIAASLAYFRVQKPHAASGYSTNIYAEKMRGWFFRSKTEIKDKIVQVKKLTENKTAKREEIHFEFYSTLPKMKVKSSTNQS